MEEVNDTYYNRRDALAFAVQLWERHPDADTVIATADMFLSWITKEASNG